MKKLLLFSILGLVGCTAQIADPNGGSTPGAGAGGGLGSGMFGGPTSPGAPGQTGAGATAQAGPMPLRRLSRDEYDATVADLLGDTTHPGRDFPEDERDEADGQRLSPFRRPGAVGSLLASRLLDAASALAGAADVAKLLPCQPTSADEAKCADSFVTQFGLKAFRRPVLPEEKSRLLALYQQVRTAESADFTGGIRAIIEAMLLSGPFLYHWELGPQPATLEGGLVQLGPYEIASRLSYFLTGTMPDTELLGAAAQGKLATEADVTAQATRLFASPRAKASLRNFFQQWLGLDEMPERSKDAATYPQFTDALKDSMIAELNELTGRVMLDGDGRLESLLTDGKAFVDPALAELYGLDAAGSMKSPEAMMLAPRERSGLLTRAGFQALYGGPKGSNPIKRGAEIYRRLLCGTVPKPPANVPPAKEPSEGGTTRMRFAEHGSNACAKGCHGLFDAFGFAFENYDGIGRYRTLDNDLPVDASGSVLLDGAQVSFEDGVELSRKLADSQQVRGCLSAQVASYGLGRTLTDADRASVDAATAAYQPTGGGIRALLAAFAASTTFRYRLPAEGEVLK
ncbi:MAG TPA: DUF1592 domain-containing protein [Polyangiaceae bacterium]|nr:DUF1592 domain-containing protein [Polyangiaceae bacterium]